MTDRKNWFADLTLITLDVAELLEKGGIDSIEKLLATEPEALTEIVGSPDVASEMLDEAEALQATPTVVVEIPEAFPWYLPIDVISYDVAQQLEAAGIDSIEKILELAGSNDLAMILEDDDLAAAIHEQASTAGFFDGTPNLDNDELDDEELDLAVAKADPNLIPDWVFPVSVISLIGTAIGIGWIFLG